MGSAVTLVKFPTTNYRSFQVKKAINPAVMEISENTGLKIFFYLFKRI